MLYNIGSCIRITSERVSAKNAARAGAPCTRATKENIGPLSYMCWSIGPCDRATRDRASAIYPARAGCQARQLFFTAMATRRMLPELPALVVLRPVRPTMRLRPGVVPLLADPL